MTNTKILYLTKTKVKNIKEHGKETLNATVAAVFTQSLIFKRCNNQLLCNSMPLFAKVEVLLPNKRGNPVFIGSLSFEPLLTMHLPPPEDENPLLFPELEDENPLLFPELEDENPPLFPELPLQVVRFPGTWVP